MTAEQISSLKEAGYLVHHGTAADGVYLTGLYWWTAFQDTWSGVAVSAGEWATEDEAWSDAARDHLGPFHGAAT